MRMILLFGQEQRTSTQRLDKHKCLSQRKDKLKPSGELTRRRQKRRESRRGEARRGEPAKEEKKDKKEK